MAVVLMDGIIERQKNIFNDIRITAFSSPQKGILTTNKHRKMNDNLTTNASNEAENPAFLVGAVMRSAFHVQLRLEDLQLNYNDCKQWYDAALKKYEDEKRGGWMNEADPNEYLEAARQLSQIKCQIDEIKWVLNLS